MSDGHMTKMDVDAKQMISEYGPGASFVIDAQDWIDLRADLAAARAEVERLRIAVPDQVCADTLDRALAAERARDEALAEFKAYRNEREPEYRKMLDEAEEARSTRDEALAALREVGRLAVDAVDCTDPIVYEKDWASDDPKDSLRTLHTLLFSIIQKSRVLAPTDGRGEGCACSATDEAVEKARVLLGD